MSKHIDLAKKLKALADKGVGGEKTNAEAMLKELMKKHGISLTDIEDEKIEDYYFTLEENEFSLWRQIVGHVNNSIIVYGKFPKSLMKKYNLTGNYMIQCTASEYIEIEAKNNFYQRLYLEELGVFYKAFIMANHLEAKSKGKDKEMTPKELEEYYRANRMASGIKVGQFMKQLEQKKLK